MLPRAELSSQSAALPGSAWTPRIAASVIVIVLLVLNLSGRGATKVDVLSPGNYGPQFVSYDVRHHGWPLTCFERDYVQVTGQRSWRLSSWRLWEGIQWFSWAGAMANLTVAAGLVLAAVVATSRYCRTRGLRVGVGGLLVAVGLCGLACGWLGRSVAEYRQERALLKSIGDSEGAGLGLAIEQRIEWEWRGPDWLRSVAGNDAIGVFDRVVAVDVPGSVLPKLVKLRRLKVVRVRGSVLNADLAQLTAFPELEALDLMMVGVSDEGEPMRLDDDGLEIEPDIELPRLPGLRGLNLYDAAFLGRGLENIPNIENLDMTHTEINDDGVAALSHCPRLRVVSLVGTKVTDGSLPVLQMLTELQELDLRDTAVSAAGVDRLRAALPTCQILH